MKLCRKCCSTDRNPEGNCRPCQSRRSAAGYLANKDRRLRQCATWKKENRANVASVKAAWGKDNPAKIAAYRKKHKASNAVTTAAWQARNRSRVLRNVAAYRAANKEKCKAATEAWGKENPEALRRYSNDRRARKMARGGKLSKGILEKLFSLQAGKCACCRADLTKTIRHLDHVMPLSKGGAHDDSNIQLLCRTCNLSKHAKHPIDFMQERGFLL